MAKRKEWKPKNKLEAFIAQSIDVSGRTQAEIAADCDYQKPNIITMFKQGSTKIPLGKVPCLANAMGVAPAKLMRLVLQTYYPDVHKTLSDVFGDILSPDERKLIAAVRKKTNDGDIDLTPTQIKKAVAAL